MRDREKRRKERRTFVRNTHLSVIIFIWLKVNHSAFLPLRLSAAEGQRVVNAASSRGQPSFITAASSSHHSLLNQLLSEKTQLKGLFKHCFWAETSWSCIIVTEGSYCIYYDYVLWEMALVLDYSWHVLSHGSSPLTPLRPPSSFAVAPCHQSHTLLFQTASSGRCPARASLPTYPPSSCPERRRLEGELESAAAAGTPLKRRESIK